MDWRGDPAWRIDFEFVTHWDEPGEYTVQANSPCGNVDSTQIYIVKVDKIVKFNTEPPEEGPLYACLDGSVILEAKPYPSNTPSSSWPPNEGEIGWSITNKPGDSNPSLTPDSGEQKKATLGNLDKPGDYEVEAKTIGCIYPMYPAEAHEGPGDTITVKVIEVASLLPDSGVEFDDEDDDPNTKSFAVGVVKPSDIPNVVTVTATPNPSVSEENLPDCWSLVGGTGTSKLTRTVDKTMPGITTITCTSGSSSKTTKIYAVKVNLTAGDLYGTVADDDEESPGAFVHFNLDNDNSSDNSVGAPKRPGADYLETTSSVSGENDLKSLTMSLNPSLTKGSMVLTISTGEKIWKDGAKGSSNLVLASGSKTWDLSIESQRNEFNDLCSGLHVEGVNTGSGNIVLKYKLSGTDVHFDKVNYTFIAADCGDQPRTDNGQRGRLEGAFPLVRCEWSITHNTLTNAYNCIAWSVDDLNHWWTKVHTVPGTNVKGIDQEYGNPKNDEFEISDLNNFYFQLKGYTPTANGPSDATVMYYSAFHAAKKKSCGCGAGKWIMYESKCGGWERIEHDWDQLNGDVYGTPTRFYK